MRRNFKDTFISAIIIGLISLITFFIGLKLYYSNDKENNKKIDENIVNDNNQILNEKEIENSKLKKEIEYLINKDSIENINKKIKIEEQNKLLDNEILTYTSSVQKYLSFTKNKKIKTLNKHKKKLANYYSIKGLSDNANRFLKTSIKLVDNEINLIMNSKIKSNSSEVIIKDKKDSTKTTSDENMKIKTKIFL